MMNTTKLQRSELQFDYFSENYLRFEEDFYEFSNSDIPLTFMTDDLLLSMAKSQKNYFKLSRRSSMDDQDHYFMFKVKMADKRKKIRTYEYVGHQLNLA